MRLMGVTGSKEITKEPINGGRDLNIRSGMNIILNLEIAWLRSGSIILNNN
jgi:hypothetical protein